MMADVNVYCRKCREDDLPTILEWRTRPDITKFMNTDPKLTMDDQRRWFRKITKDKNSFYWIIECDGLPIGLINLVNWDRTNNSIHTGLYIAVNEKRSMPLLMDLMSNLNDYAFLKLGVNKVTKEIMDINKNLILINERFGFKKEGVMRQVVLKHGIYHDLHVFGMLRAEWEEISSMLDYQKIEFE